MHGPGLVVEDLRDFPLVEGRKTVKIERRLNFTWLVVGGATGAGAGAKLV